MRERQLATIDNYSLCYRTDSHDLSIMEEVWEKGAYADHFPAGKRAVIIDVGAHNGYFSLYAARRTAAGSRIYAFEPMADNFEILTGNLAMNGVDKVVARQSCVAAVDGTLRLYVNHAHTGGHSQYRERIEKYRLNEIEPVDSPCVAFRNTVPAGTEQIDYCKIDCEGAEFDLLLGTPPDFLRKVAVYAIEFHEFGGHRVEELLQLFRSLGYRVSHRFSPSKLGISFGYLLALRGEVT